MFREEEEEEEQGGLKRRKLDNGNATEAAADAALPSTSGGVQQQSSKKDANKHKLAVLLRALANVNMALTQREKIDRIAKGIADDEAKVRMATHPPWPNFPSPFACGRCGFCHS